MVENFIEVQKEHKNEKLSLSYHIIGESGDYKVEPLLFIPILENAFRFGMDDVRESFIDIVLIILEKQIQFKVTNRNLPFRINNSTDSGSGLIELKRRLDLIYPSRHYFKVEETKDIFTVRLILQLED